MVKVVDRLRPHAAHRRVRGDPRARDRGDPEAVPAGHRRRDRARPVRHARRGHRRRSPASSASGVGPQILEYIDMLTMAAATAYVGLDLGVPQDVKDAALAYLVVSLEAIARRPARRGRGRRGRAAGRAGRHRRVRAPAGGRGEPHRRPREGVLGRPRRTAPTTSSTSSSRARRSRSTWPRWQRSARSTRSWIAGCGHAGDGNVHLAVFQKDPEVPGAGGPRAVRGRAARWAAPSAGEHGLGTEKRAHFLRAGGPDQARPHAPHQGGLRPARHPQPGDLDLPSMERTAHMRSSARSSTPASTSAS